MGLFNDNSDGEAKKDSKILNSRSGPEKNINPDGKNTEEDRFSVEGRDILQVEIEKIKNKYETLLDGIHDLVEVINPTGIIEYVSPSAQSLLGYSPQSLIGTSIFNTFNEDDIAKFKGMIIYLLNNPSETARIKLKRKTKSEYIVFSELRMRNYLQKPWIKGIVVYSSDITYRVKMQEKLDYVSTHDGITLLPNQEYFNKSMELYRQEAEGNRSTFALFMLDVDDFQYINNALGYSVGNDLIIQIGKRIKEYLDCRGLICRYSGDQFAIVVGYVEDLKDYASIANGIIDIFVSPFIIGKYEVKITASIGVSIYPRDGEDIDTLLKHCSIALFHAKNGGKNRYKFFFEDASISSYKEFELRNDLAKSIERNQLVSYFQPIVNIKTGKILAAEALIRWEHPVWGLVPPNEFISLAEETGFIIDLGEWMLREICSKYKGWMSKGLPEIKMSLNYSSVQLFEKDFVENIKNMLKEFELDSKFLIIEIAEDVLRKCDQITIDEIMAIQDLGIEVALDDFGSGFSSLSCFESFNVDMLKMNSYFLKEIPSNTKNAIISKSIIKMGQELKIKLVAKGIETWGQLSYLRGLNCFAGQGYIFSKPLPLKEFEKVLKGKVCHAIRDESWEPEVFVERRKFFRVKFYQLLESTMTLLELNYKKIKVGSTMVLIKNMGPGGLCFTSNIRLPVKNGMLMQFVTNLIEKEIKVTGSPVWTREVGDNLHEYGVKFTIDEKERRELIQILNQVQIKMRNNILFAEGSFVSTPAKLYFKSKNRR